jgi:hypothetical protein
MSLGDGGGTGDPFENGQDTEELLGKVLHIDPRPGQVPPYSIPAGNPFDGTAGRDEIWAYGLRNPWRFSFDRATGDMVIADVGQSAREEIDVAASPAPGVVGGAGANYGWNCREGFIAYTNPAAACATASGFTEPVFDYPHSDPGGGAAYGCSIIGGYVVRDPGVPDLYGRYLSTDYCSQGIRSSAAAQRRARLRRSLRGAHGEKADLVWRGLLWARLRCLRRRACLSLRRPEPDRLPGASSGRAVIPDDHAAEKALEEIAAPSPAALGKAVASGGFPLQAQSQARSMSQWGRPAGAAQSQRQELRRQAPRPPLPGAVPGHRRQADPDPRFRPPRQGRAAHRLAPADPATAATAIRRISAARCGRSRWRSPSRSGRRRASLSGRAGAARP